MSVTIEYNGKKYKSLADACVALGLSYPRTYARYQDFNLSIDEVLNPEIRQKKYKDHLGNTFKTIQEMCAFWKIGTATFSYRRKMGHSLEYSLTAPLQKQGKAWMLKA